MKSVLLGILLMIVVSVAAWFVTDLESESTAEEYTSENNSVRLDQ